MASSFDESRDLLLVALITFAFVENYLADLTTSKGSKELNKGYFDEGYLNNIRTPKSIAFEVPLENNNIDSLVDKHLPKRLQPKLAPLVNAPTLTTESLAERQKQVEANRQKELEKKKEVSRRSSRLRRQLVQAREFEKAQAQYREIEEKQLSAGKIREAKLAQLEKRKTFREERAKRVRDRAARLQHEGEEDLDFEVEKDVAFNADDTDSWLGDDDREGTDHQHTDMGERLYSGTERLYSGRESPAKKFYSTRTTAEMAARHSASTTDSFDYAFQRAPPTNGDKKADDFFDT